MPIVEIVRAPLRRTGLRRGLSGSAAVLLALALTLISSVASATSKRDRDNFWNPPPNGPSLKAMAFWWPGLRLTFEDHIPLEQDMSEVKFTGIADVNPGFTEASWGTDVRIFLFELGGAAGYRYDWHLLQFEPDATGKDHGQTTLNVDARKEKNYEGDWSSKAWPWAEARFRLILPLDTFFGISTVALRYEDRVDNSYDFNFATVYDKGTLMNWESYVVYRNKHLGFVGPALRVLNVPRTLADGEKTRQTEVQYGVFAGTQPGWSSGQDLILFRAFTTAGFDNDLFGLDINWFGLRFKQPVSFILGYQTDLTF